MTPRGTDPITCGVCGNVSSLDECDCGLLPMGWCSVQAVLR